MKPKHLAIMVLVVEYLLCATVCGDEVAECKRLAKKYKAQLEVVVGDGVRVDLLNDEYAIEADWNTHKIYEAFGQAALYSVYTGKKPAVLILVPKGQGKKETDKWLKRARLISEKLKIRMYVEQAQGA